MQYRKKKLKIKARPRDKPEAENSHSRCLLAVEWWGTFDIYTTGQKAFVVLQGSGQ